MQSHVSAELAKIGMIIHVNLELSGLQPLSVPRELQICQQAPEEDKKKSIQGDYTLGLMSAELARFC